MIPASEREHVGCVRWVTRHTDIDVDHVNDLGWTALLEAVILGDGGKDDMTPLQHARNRGFTEIADLLERR